MGREFELKVWKDYGNDVWDYLTVWEGDDLDQAIAEMKRLKTSGIACVDLTWRGTVRDEMPDMQS
jgi:hypothetical protein